MNLKSAVIFKSALEETALKIGSFFNRPRSYMVTLTLEQLSPSIDDFFSHFVDNFLEIFFPIPPVTFIYFSSPTNI